MTNRILCSLLTVFVLSGALAAEERMQRVDSGTFMPLYTLTNEPVTVDSFLLDSHPVTNAEFLEFVRESPEWSRSAVKPIFAQSGYLAHWTSDFEFPEEIAESPVVNVSWFAARAYAKSRDKRLPTLHEWEFAGRASETDPNAAADQRFVNRILGWYSQPPTEPLSPVGRGFRNVYGVWDMHGLVWEWVDDFSSVLVSGESRKGGETDRQLFCAAGVQGSSDPGDYAAFMRYALRSSLKANFTLKTLGFRCAKSLEPAEVQPRSSTGEAPAARLDAEKFRTPLSSLDALCELLIESFKATWEAIVSPVLIPSTSRKEGLVYDPMPEP